MNYIPKLVALKKRSLRRGIWHKVLNNLERAQINLTVRIVKKVRSSFLTEVLDLIINKLYAALQSKVLMMVKSVGFPLALKLSEIAQSWGHTSAKTWAEDPKFARFLAVMNLNSIRTYPQQQQNC